MKEMARSLVVLCLAFAWACVEVDVSVPTRTAHPVKIPKPIPSIPGKKSISLEQLKTIQAQKTSTSCDPKSTSSLDVRLEVQQTSAWCWVASTRIVMNYQKKVEQKADDQCKIVMRVLGPAGCCTPVISIQLLNQTVEVRVPPLACLRGGWPSDVFQKYGFDYDQTAVPLDWEALTNEICLNGPFIFVVDWRGGGRHALLVKGYNNVESKTTPIRKQQIVQIYDPAAMRGFVDVTYEAFAGDPPGNPNKAYGFAHLRDYVQIRPLP